MTVQALRRLLDAWNKANRAARDAYSADPFALSRIVAVEHANGWRLRRLISDKAFVALIDEARSWMQG